MIAVSKGTFVDSMISIGHDSFTMRFINFPVSVINISIREQASAFPMSKIIFIFPDIAVLNIIVGALLEKAVAFFAGIENMAEVLILVSIFKKALSIHDIILPIPLINSYKNFELLS